MLFPSWEDKGESIQPITCVSSTLCSTILYHLPLQTMFIRQKGLKPPPASSLMVLEFSETMLLLRRLKEALDFP